MRARLEKHVRRSLAGHVAIATNPRNHRPCRHRAARAAAREAEQLGLIIRPDSCERCGDREAFLERHHPDHGKPLCVEYLCGPCHKTADSETPPNEGETLRGHCA